MARGGRTSMNVNYTEVQRNLSIALSRVERGTKKATLQACEEIRDLSLAEVPRETNTLAESFFYEVQGAYRNFTATLGYGGKGDPVNPKTGEHASEYMVAVHEDLQANHPVGKAKFLEDPVNRYKARFLPGAAATIRAELGG